MMIRKPRFTPRPWRVEPGTYEGGKQLKVVPYDPNDSAYIMIGGSNKKFNAQLLADAPEMIHLLRSCLAWWETMPKEQQPDPAWLKPIYELVNKHYDKEEKANDPLMIPLILNTKFKLGTLCFTAGIRGWAVNDPEFAKFIVVIIQRHANGDWGDLEDHDNAENEFSLKEGFRILSAYKWKEEKIWIITEANRSSTTVLFPNEY